MLNAGRACVQSLSPTLRFRNAIQAPGPKAKVSPRGRVAERNRFSSVPMHGIGTSLQGATTTPSSRNTDSPKRTQRHPDKSNPAPWQHLHIQPARTQSPSLSKFLPSGIWHPRNSHPPAPPLHPCRARVTVRVCISSNVRGRREVPQMVWPCPSRTCHPSRTLLPCEEDETRLHTSNLPVGASRACVRACADTKPWPRARAPEMNLANACMHEWMDGWGDGADAGGVCIMGPGSCAL